MFCIFIELVLTKQTQLYTPGLLCKLKLVPKKSQQEQMSRLSANSIFSKKPARVAWLSHGIYTHSVCGRDSFCLFIYISWHLISSFWRKAFDPRISNFAQFSIDSYSRRAMNGEIIKAQYYRLPAQSQCLSMLWAKWRKKRAKTRIVTQSIRPLSLAQSNYRANMNRMTLFNHKLWHGAIPTYCPRLR